MIPGQRSLGQEDPLEMGMANHSRILAWRVPCTDHGVAKSQDTTQGLTHTHRELRADMRWWHSQKGKKNLQNLYTKGLR